MAHVRLVLGNLEPGTKTLFKNLDLYYSLPLATNFLAMDDRGNGLETSSSVEGGSQRLDIFSINSDRVIIGYDVDFSDPAPHNQAISYYLGTEFGVFNSEYLFFQFDPFREKGLFARSLKVFFNLPKSWKGEMGDIHKFITFVACNGG